MKSVAFSFIFILLTALLHGQMPASDTLKTLDLKEVAVSAHRDNLKRLPPTQGTYIWTGKKNEVIELHLSDVNIAEKTGRQIFAKVPGLFVYDMDGTGNQMNISTRGLDPHRGWEFNIRKNGVITNSDIYGYPASHYSLPMEAIERIELVRGTGALQYGAQFGGMLNYVVKQPDSTKTIGLESINAIGSFGLLSTYNAIGGKSGKLQYYAYYSKRVSEGYRDNGRSDYDGQSVILKYSASPRVTLSAELARSNYLYRIPGPLTDSMFHENPRQATRSRNYFNPEIYVPSLTLDWALGENTLLKWTTSAVLGQRRSVLFDRTALVPDTIVVATLQYNPRVVDIDRFNSYTSELRLLHTYSLAQRPATVTAGVQVFNNDLHRTQLGKGSTGSDPDFSTVQPGWGRDIHLKTRNIAVFVENLLQLTKKLSLTPGMRYELGDSKMSGTITYLPNEQIPNTIEHNFPLLGIQANYQLNTLQELYAGWSQAYRPIIFKDIIPGSVMERADKNLKDAKGYNLELGYRGTSGNLRWDISAFRLQYDNRLGNLVFQEGDETVILRTNIGNSVNHGVEFFAEYAFKPFPYLRCNLFSSTAFMDARYENAQIRVGNENRNIDGNEVESVPHWISRNGLNLKYRNFSFSVLYSYTAQSFADPLNTEKPSATGAVGIVPHYGLLDLNASWRLSPSVMLRCNFNNVTDKQYFTKRPTFYPGPGVWPSDGRSINFSIGARI